MPDSVAKYLNKEGLETYNDSLPHSHAQMQEYVNDWLDAHPEATTTVQPNTITDAMLVQSGGILSQVNSIGENVARNTNFVSGFVTETYGAIVSNVKRCVYFLEPDIPVRVRIFTDDYFTALYRWDKNVLNVRHASAEKMTDGFILLPTQNYALVCRNATDVSIAISESEIATISENIKIEPLYYLQDNIKLAYSVTGIEYLPIERCDFSINTLEDANASTYSTKRVRSQKFIIKEPKIIRLDADDLYMSVISTNGIIATNIKECYLEDTSLIYRVSIYHSNTTNDITNEDFENIRSLGLYPAYYCDKFSSRLMAIFTSFTTIGDSLMAGYTSTGGVTHNSQEALAARNNWPSYLAMELNRTFENIAVGGSSAKDWRETHIPTANIPTNCYLVGLGVNDARQHLTIGSPSDIQTNYTDNANTFYGNYDFIIRSLKSYNSPAHIFIFTIPNTEANNSDYNNAIRYIGGLYTKVHVIDLNIIYKHVYSDSFLPKVWNGHSTPLGYMYMGQMILAAINSYMQLNYSLFNSTPYE